MRPSPRRYRNRDEAGRVLADLVVALLHDPAADGPAPLVLGLPRGGVPVAGPVAHRIGGDLDVLTVRKVGTPGQRELAMGAVATGGLTVLNDDLIRQLGLSTRDVERAADAARRELAEQERRFRPGAAPLAIDGRLVVVVDDGLATGATMRAALRAVRTARPARLVAAVPVGAPDSCQLVAQLADDLVCPLRPTEFSAVGQWYQDFSATTDRDVLALLGAG